MSKQYVFTLGYYHFTTTQAAYASRAIQVLGEMTEVTREYGGSETYYIPVEPGKQVNVELHAVDKSAVKLDDKEAQEARIVKLTKEASEACARSVERYTENSKLKKELEEAREHNTELCESLISANKEKAACQDTE